MTPLLLAVLLGIPPATHSQDSILAACETAQRIAARVLSLETRLVRDSRIAHHIDFPDYGEGELMQIAEKMLAAQHYRFGDGARAAFEQYLARRMQQPHFANARSVRNALERARLRAASRLFADRDRVLTESDLTTLMPADILASRVFQPPAS